MSWATSTTVDRPGFGDAPLRVRAAEERSIRARSAGTSRDARPTKMTRLDRRSFLRATGASLGASALGCAGAARPADRPNLVFVFADQLRADALGCAGDPNVRTPVLDRLAAESRVLDEAVSTSPTCRPFRQQLFAGRWPHAFGVTLRPDTPTLPELAQRAGFATGYVGKWHLTPRELKQDDGWVPPAYRRGWDFWAGHERFHDYTDPVWFVNDEREPVRAAGYEPTLQTDMALEFVERHRARPFCLFLSWGPPHNPYEPPPEHDTYRPADVVLRPNVPADLGDPARASLAHYYGLTTSLDREMERVLDALDEHGLAENTVVVFTSDHGDQLFSHGAIQKRRPWSEACRIPLFVRWPGRIAPGPSALSCGSIDLVPTLARLIGLDRPSWADGRDLSAALLQPAGAEGDRERPQLLEVVDENQFTPWHATWRAVRTPRYTYARSAAFADGEWLLVDRREDPHELRNRIDDPAARGLKDQLGRELERLQRESGDTWSAAAEHARWAGEYGHVYRGERAPSRSTDERGLS